MTTSDIKRSPHLIISHGDKGGVGKSTVCRTLLYWYRKAGIDVIAIDSDIRNSQFHRYYNALHTVTRIDIEEKKGFDQIISSVINPDSPEKCLIDLPAGAGNEIDEFFSKFGKRIFSDLNLKMTIVYTLSRSKDSVMGLNRTLGVFEDLPVQFIAVRNLYSGDAEKFVIWESAKKTREKLKAASGSDVSFPDMDDLIFSVLDEQSLPFEKAGDGGLGYMDTVRLDGWLDEACEMFDSVKEHL